MLRKYHRFINLTTVLFLSVTLILGCSSGGRQTPPVLPDNPSSVTESTGSSVSQGINTHHLLSYNPIQIDATDPDDIKAEIIPARAGSMHLNILKFLEFAPCTDCFKIVGLNFPQPGILDVDIEITHPFDDMNFTIFDVRGVMMFNGSHTFPVSGLTMPDSSLGDGELLNAEGYTQLYNGSTLGMAGDFFTYYKGKLATPTVPNANLNGFVRHISSNPSNTRNALYPADSVTRTYSLAMPSGQFVLGYAVDASWDLPTVDPVTDPMTQFPATANCIEPWKIVVTEEKIGDGLTDEGGQTMLIVDVYDWQDKDTHVEPVLECPEIFGGVISADWIEDGLDYSRYAATVTNTHLAEYGVYMCCISVEDNENAISPEYIDLTAYQLFNLFVTPSSTNGCTAKAAYEPENPIVCEKIHFFDNGTIDNDGLGIVTYEWDWDNDGTFDEEGKDVYHTWNTSGLYMVGFKATNVSGASCEIMLDVSVVNIIVNFPDANLENVIRETISKPTGDIYAEDLCELVVLDAISKDITSIEGLQFCFNLVSLDLCVNKIIDISPLQSLTSIYLLDLTGNTINDITPLQNLTMLNYLLIGGNNISNLTPLQNLTSLICLYSSGSQITDLTPLENLTGLESLGLTGNFISDLTPLQNLTELESLGLSSNSISNITPIQNLTELEDLCLAFNPLSNITPIQNLTKLIYLDLSNCQISDITPLQNLTELEIIVLTTNSIVEITSLQNLTAVHSLYLAINEISDIYPLVLNSYNGGLGSGNEVWLNFNPLSDTSIDVYLPQLVTNGVIVHYND